MPVKIFKQHERKKIKYRPKCHGTCSLVFSALCTLCNGGTFLGQETNGSYTKGVTIDINVLALVLRTRKVHAHDFLNTPSTPKGPMADTMFWVNRNGTLSGQSNDSPERICQFYLINIVNHL